MLTGLCVRQILQAQDWSNLIEWIDDKDINTYKRARGEQDLRSPVSLLNIISLPYGGIEERGAWEPEGAHRWRWSWVLHARYRVWRCVLVSLQFASLSSIQGATRSP